MHAWVEWYKKIFGFIVSEDYDQQIRGKRTRFNVLQPEDGRIKILIHEDPSFTELLKGSGVQHVGLLTLKIQEAAKGLKSRNIQLSTPPPQDDKDITKHIKSLKESPEELKALGILAEGDNNGYLLQCQTKDFIKPFCFEFIERKNFKGFGTSKFF
jgi:4-hydroxyphenylpyruvate dioxygenase